MLLPPLLSPSLSSLALSLYLFFVLVPARMHAATLFPPSPRPRRRPLPTHSLNININNILPSFFSRHETLCSVARRDRKPRVQLKLGSIASEEKAERKFVCMRILRRETGDGGNGGGRKKAEAKRERKKRQGEKRERKGGEGNLLQPPFSTPAIGFFWGAAGVRGIGGGADC